MLSLIPFPAIESPTVSSMDFPHRIDRVDGVTASLLACGKVEIARWNRRLNAVYAKLLAQPSSHRRQSVRKRQRSWLLHHLAEMQCIARHSDDGSVALLESQAFELSDLTSRTEWLAGAGGTMGP